MVVVLLSSVPFREARVERVIIDHDADRMRPLSLGEILDRAFQIYRSHIVTFAGQTENSSASTWFNQVQKRYKSILNAAVTRSAEPIGFARMALQRDPRNTVSRALPCRCGTP
jgi:hypothetical protein